MTRAAKGFKHDNIRWPELRIPSNHEFLFYIASESILNRLKIKKKNQTDLD